MEAFLTMRTNLQNKYETAWSIYCSIICVIYVLYAAWMLTNLRIVVIPIELAKQASCTAIMPVIAYIVNTSSAEPSTSNGESSTSRAQPQQFMSMSSSLGTPFKMDVFASSLKTTDFSILDESNLKSPLFPMPSVLITPGATFTPPTHSKTSARWYILIKSWISRLNQTTTHTWKLWNELR